MGVREQVQRYIDEQWPRYLEEVRQFLRQPGISYTGEGVQESAEMVADYLRRLGARDVHLARFGGHPIVYGELRTDRPRAKTLVNYGMNDVMPVDEPDWRADPFGAEIMPAEEFGAEAELGDIILARGSFNQRAPMHAFLRAIEAIQHVTKSPPCNFIFCFEHEEEMGSLSMPKFRDAYADRLKGADAVFYGRMAQDEHRRHIVYLGAKGIVKVELIVEGGAWGGPAVRNLHSSDDNWLDHPTWRLIWALNSIRDERDQVLIEEFHENYRPPTPEERAMIKKLEDTFDEQAWARRQGVMRYKRGLPAKEMLEHFILGPVVNIDGILSGWTGPDVKTIMPRRAMAKMDIRLVPNMTYEEVDRKLRHHLAKRGFSEVQVHTENAYDWYRASIHDEINQAILKACEIHEVEPVLWPTHIAGFPGAIFTKPPLNLPMGTAGLGYGAQAHSVNEFVTVQGLRDCIKYCASFLLEYTGIA